jgi:hypothetical protein
VKRGQGIEVIEDLPELRDVRVSVRVPGTVRRVTLEPQGREVPFRAEGGRVTFVVERLVCHQMAVLQ